MLIEVSPCAPLSSWCPGGPKSSAPAGVPGRGRRVLRRRRRVQRLILGRRGGGGLFGRRLPRRRLRPLGGRGRVGRCLAEGGRYAERHALVGRAGDRGGRFRLASRTERARRLLPRIRKIQT